jgi:peptidoglycan L-alanyl-D-glutamate endopeptidase CwlK
VKGQDRLLQKLVTRMTQTGWVLIYFVLASAGLALLVFPHWRQALALIWQRWWQRGRQQGERMGQHLGGQARRAPERLLQQTGAGVQSARHWWSRRWTWVLGGGTLLSLPVVLTLSWSLWGNRTLDGFDDRIDPLHPQVAYLLQGEHLVPPPPLPPQVFDTAEVEVVRPLLASADRRWDQMDPEFVQALLHIFKVMKEEHGYDMALLEGWRSPERQAMLAAKGTHVTMAGAWQSYHQYGLGADCAFYRDGKLIISEKDPWAMRGYQLYGEVAERFGLTWGGRWQMMDLGHVEWRKPGARQAMRAARYR